MSAETIRVRVQLPYGSNPERGPGWTDVWCRVGTSDEAVMEEVWVQDCYRVRGLGRTNAEQPGFDWRPADSPIPPPRIIDIGACSGIFAALVCQSFPGAQVIAVEPAPGNVGLLRQNLAKWYDRAHIVDAAVGASEGSVAIVGGGATGHTDGNPTEGQLVEQITLDSLIDGRPVALLKLDAEGSEYPILRASEQLALVDRIHAEWHGTAEAPWVDDAPRQYGEMMTKLAYTHSVQAFGTPDKGGYLFATRYNL